MLRMFAALAAALGVALSAQVQTYPGKAARLVVPFATGGSSEIIARTLTRGGAQGGDQGGVMRRVVLLIADCSASATTRLAAPAGAMADVRRQAYD